MEAPGGADSEAPAGTDLPIQLQTSGAGDRKLVPLVQIKARAAQPNAGSLQLLGNGLELGEQVSLGIPENDDFVSDCVQSPELPRKVMTRIRGRRGGHFHQLSFGCEDISTLLDSGSEAQWTLPVGQNVGNYFEIVPPTGFVLVGWRSKTCEDKISELSGLAKKVDPWGLVDGTIWEGSRITSSNLAQFCSEKTQMCPPGFVITAAEGQMKSTVFGKALKNLGMECRKVLSSVKKPKVQSVTVGAPRQVEVAPSPPGKPCELSCKTAEHPEGILVGLEFDYLSVAGEEDYAAHSWVEKIKLVCQDLSKTGFSYPSFGDLRSTGTCGKIASNHEDEIQEGSLRLWSGFAPTGVQSHQQSTGFKALAFYLRPLDIFSQNPLSAGPDGAWERLSNRAGRNLAAAPLIKKCQEGEVITGLNFWLREDNDLLQGIKSLNCSAVNRDLQ